MKQIMMILAITTLTATAIFSQTTTMKMTNKEKKMTATGTFDVKVIPQPQDDAAAGPFGRLFLDKQFNGDLTAKSLGQMIATQSETEGSGAYSALERVTGTLDGKRGSFVLQHTGTMQKDNYFMNVTVVPDSGTDELKGITGTMKIIIEKGKHSYEFTYSFAAK